MHHAYYLNIAVWRQAGKANQVVIIIMKQLAYRARRRRFQIQG
jgi:hypothetical protein